MDTLTVIAVLVSLLNGLFLLVDNIRKNRKK